MKPNLALIVPVTAAGAAVVVAVILAAHAHGKRRERRAWLIDRSAQ